MEIEAKFCIPDELTYQSLRTTMGLAGYRLEDASERTLKDTYLDTPDRSVAGAGFTLRQRVWDDGVAVTLKQVAEAGAEDATMRREEVEATLALDEAARAEVLDGILRVEALPPGPLRRRILDIAGDARLERVLSLEQRRIARNAWDGERHVAEVSLDRVEVQGGGRRQQYRELEVELRSDANEADLSGLSQSLRLDWGLRPETRSKFARALEIVAGEAYASGSPAGDEEPAAAAPAAGETQIGAAAAEETDAVAVVAEGPGVDAAAADDDAFGWTGAAELDAQVAATAAGVKPAEEVEPAAVGEAAAKGEAAEAAPAEEGGPGTDETPADEVEAEPTGASAEEVEAEPAGAPADEEKAEPTEASSEQDRQAETSAEDGAGSESAGIPTLSVPPEDAPVAAAPDSPGIKADDLMSEAARKTLLYQLEKMLAHEEGTRLGQDYEELHDMRVASRRMRAALAVFAPYVDETAYEPFRKALRRTGRKLGHVRDLDVFHEKAEKYLVREVPNDRRDELGPLFAAWEVERERRRGRMMNWLGSQAYREFVNEFDEFLSNPGAGALKDFDRDGAPVARTVRQALPVVIWSELGAVLAFEPWVVGEDVPLTRLHRLRIAGKYLRYSLEFFSDVLGPEGRLHVNRIKDLQDHLGDLQDDVVGSGIIRDFLSGDGWGRRGGRRQEQLVGAAGVATYLAFKQRELETLVATFPAAWEPIREPAFREGLVKLMARL